MDQSNDGCRLGCVPSHFFECSVYGLFVNIYIYIYIYISTILASYLNRHLSLIVTHQKVQVWATPNPHLSAHPKPLNDILKNQTSTAFRKQFAWNWPAVWEAMRVYAPDTLLNLTLWDIQLRKLNDLRGLFFVFLYRGPIASSVPNLGKIST